ncbi:hypothetical protein [Aureliella helgolandensis]|uniref:PLD phosphodiesterase domain-containing protein n=1 Tax=Aureliella helgolandensis TaxID=2527968 RepID=A0A518G9P1_9BACT|nr:hypothetical protein [Aureliella helgolandensis]QDV25301.1 hypothetical protein Q31a_36250 [Aureliella helgolandensis]
MAKRKKADSAVAMLELWRPPADAGEAIGCLATTFTFQPSLFEEQCLARFLQIDSDPQREELAYLLEREANLGRAYAGVLVDRTQSGVEHSMRWDVLPVRIPNGKQHAKLSLLAWDTCVRVIVSSANLTAQGYRSNQEVTLSVDSFPNCIARSIVREAIRFLQSLNDFVPSGDDGSPQKERALAFLNQVTSHTADWKSLPSDPMVRQTLVATLPRNIRTGEASRSSLAETLQDCSKAGAPEEIWTASPFFDVGSENDATTEALCKAMARGRTRSIYFAVPSLDPLGSESPRLAAPKSLLHTSKKFVDRVEFEILPHADVEGHERPWHAKMLALRRNNDAGGYSALMIGSSNFTKAGMGIKGVSNAELNLLTIVKLGDNSKLVRQLDQVWPEMEVVDNLSEDLLQGPVSELEEEERSEASSVPLGFVSASFHTGDCSKLIIEFNAASLPAEWICLSLPEKDSFTLTNDEWQTSGCEARFEAIWRHSSPPIRLLVRWVSSEGAWTEGFLPINVDNPSDLPAPTEIESMSSDEILMILAASDPGAALRVWAAGKVMVDSGFDEELDSANPVDLDPLRNYSLANTFLRRIRTRAQVFARLKYNLERPVRTQRALLWRLEGFIGVKVLAERLCNEAINSAGNSQEALLSLIDFTILLREVNYVGDDASLNADQFNEVYLPFLQTLVNNLNQSIRSHTSKFGKELLAFWGRIVRQCQQ